MELFYRIKKEIQETPSESSSEHMEVSTAPRTTLQVKKEPVDQGDVVVPSILKVKRELPEAEPEGTSLTRVDVVPPAFNIKKVKREVNPEAAEDRPLLPEVTNQTRDDVVPVFNINKVKKEANPEANVQDRVDVAPALNIREVDAETNNADRVDVAVPVANRRRAAKEFVQDVVQESIAEKLARYQTDVDETPTFTLSKVKIEARALAEDAMDHDENQGYMLFESIADNTPVKKKRKSSMSHRCKKAKQSRKDSSSSDDVDVPRRRSIRIKAALDTPTINKLPVISKPAAIPKTRANPKAVPKKAKTPKAKANPGNVGKQAPAVDQKGLPPVPVSSPKLKAKPTPKKASTPPAKAPAPPVVSCSGRPVRRSRVHVDYSKDL